MRDCLASLGGSVVAIATPFRDAELDLAALALLCECQIEKGTAALVVFGSTGEAPALSPAEQAQAIQVAVEAAGARVPVIAGCSAASTDATIVLAAAAACCGANALLCAPPPYVKPTQDGLIAHIRAAAGLPIMLYDVPSRVGISIADGTIARLFKDRIMSA